MNQDQQAGGRTASAAAIDNAKTIHGAMANVIDLYGRVLESMAFEMANQTAQGTQREMTKDAQIRTLETQAREAKEKLEQAQTKLRELRTELLQARTYQREIGVGTAATHGSLEEDGWVRIRVHEIVLRQLLSATSSKIGGWAFGQMLKALVRDLDTTVSPPPTSDEKQP